jgi:septum formation protein
MAEEPQIRLASGSPRRVELLQLTGWSSEISPVQLDERPHQGESAQSLVRRLAREKAARALQGGANVVLAADTIVVHEGKILGKPANGEEARHMLAALGGNQHEVLTAITLIERKSGDQVEDLCRTTVPMRPYGMDEVVEYVDTGSPLDKAGAYGIQDDGFQPVDSEAMSGCFANVMGLPLCHLVRCMRELGYEPEADVPGACQKHNVYECDVFEGILRGEI